MELLTSIGRGTFGIIVLLFLCFLLSSNKKKVDWRLVIVGMSIQLLLAFLMLKVPFIRSIFEVVVNFFVLMMSSMEKSASFLFGDLAKPGSPYGFAFYVLPTIVFFSALSSILYYLGILQKVVQAFAWVMTKTMRLSGAESLAAAANVFIGQTEAPLVIKPYIEKMTKSEILSIMTGGMATIAGGVFGAYMGMLGGSDPERLAFFGMHLLTASIISAPAAIVAAKILYPEDQPEAVNQSLDIPRLNAGNNFLDALSNGTTDGLKLAVNVGVMLLSFMAFVYLGNEVLFKIGAWTGLNETITASNPAYDGLTMQYIFGFLFSPIAWLVGVPNADIIAMGQMLGEKTILNEFVAYASLGELKAAGVLSEKTIIIATYALCGFANFASIGIQIGGIGGIAPNQRKTITEFGLKALIGGTVATLITGAIAGIIV